MKQIGSQMRETLAESEYTLLSLESGEAVLQTSDGKRERWFKNDHYAGYVVEIDGIGYEFACSVP
jgi:hypothetical protein